MRIDPKKIQAIVEWPILLKVSKLRSFLGLANYYQRLMLGIQRWLHLDKFAKKVELNCEKVF